MYNPPSLGKAVADTLQGKKNMSVYYPSGNGVDTDAVIKQFVDQLLFRERSWRSHSSPCAHFELRKTLFTMRKGNTAEMFDHDLANKKYENKEDGAELSMIWFVLL